MAYSEWKIAGDLYLGTFTSSINVSNQPNYKNLTANNFRIGIALISSKSTSWYGTPGASASIEPSTINKTYNATTGVLSVSGGVYGILQYQTVQNGTIYQDRFFPTITYFAYLM